MDFSEEIENYTDEELELIISTQKDLYTDEEMAQLQALQDKRAQKKKEEHESQVIERLPEIINCEKCDGPNEFSNKVCVFCGHKLDKSKYYTDEYYEQYNEDDERNEDDECNEDKPSNAAANGGESFTFHYVISFLIPFVGLIVGAVMLANDDKNKSACGKVCIIIGIVSAVLSIAIINAIRF